MWMGLKCHFSGLAMDADLEMHLGRDGYVGLARIEDGRVNVCGLFQKGYGGRLSKMELLFDYISRTGNEGLVKRLRAAEPDLASFMGVAGFKLGERGAFDDTGLCEIGDADRMIPPFTGNGMSMAFQGAELALDPLERWSEGRLAWDDCIASVHAALHGKFHGRMKAASLMHPLLFRSGGRRLIESLGVSGLLPFRPLLSLVR
jgi:flavin-dependent dehydrogenase